MFAPLPPLQKNNAKPLDALVKSMFLSQPKGIDPFDDVVEGRFL